MKAISATIAGIILISLSYLAATHAANEGIGVWFGIASAFSGLGGALIMAAVFIWYLDHE